MMTLRKQPERAWRWMVLLSVLLNLSFTYLSDNFLSGLSIDVVTQQHLSLFTPAPYSFSIWGIIFISLTVYAIYQLLQSQKHDLFFDRLAQPVVLVNGLGALWIFTYRLDLMLISCVTMAAMLAVSIVIYVHIRHAVLKDDRSNWISVPFSLLSAWLSVALIANVAILFVAQGWEGSVFTQVISVITMVFLIGVLGIFVTYRCADFIFPAVISWACTAIFVAHGSDYVVIGVVALISASLPIIWFLLAQQSKRISRRHRHVGNKLSFGEAMRIKLNGQNKLIFGRL